MLKILDADFNITIINMLNHVGSRVKKTCMDTWGIQTER